MPTTWTTLDQIYFRVVVDSALVRFPFAVKNFHKDEITWISPTLNQVHQLTNIGNKHTCITIQCYMYEQENTTHYDYFDYVDDNGEIKQYEPDSDMDFVDFKKQMK